MIPQTLPKVLLVDDERINLKVLDSLLGPKYTVNLALNGEQAIKRAHQVPQPDLILLDIKMPGINGLEVCRRLKEETLTKHIPVLFLTALSSVEDERTGLELGAADYITKPFNPPVVLARVKNHLELKQQRDLLEQLTFMDALTGIANRRRFDQFLQFEWQRAIRQQQNLSLILLDIDYFKKFNDNYGHAMGDECLRKFGQALAHHMDRSTDLVARYGGEEFICVLPDTDHQGAMQVAESLRQEMLELAIPHSMAIVVIKFFKIIDI